MPDPSPPPDLPTEARVEAAYLRGAAEVTLFVESEQVARGYRRIADLLDRLAEAAAERDRLADRLERANAGWDQALDVMTEATIELVQMKSAACRTVAARSAPAPPEPDAPDDGPLAYEGFEEEEDTLP